MSKPKGIIDPWRQVDKLRPSPRPAPTEGKIDLEDIDLDADLQIPGRFVIRSEHASIDITHMRVESPRSSLDVLADCLAELRKIKPLGGAMISAGIGVRGRTGAWNVPPEGTAATVLQSTNSTMWFIGKDFNQGMLALTKLLRESVATPVVKKWGIVPMLNA